MKKSLFQCKSHPDKMLADHLQGVFDIGASLFLKSPYRENSQIKHCVFTSLICHDLGKTTGYFQKFLDTEIKKGNDEINDKEYQEIIYSLKDKNNQSYTQHSIVSSLICFYILKKHFSISDELAFISYYAVRRHHGNLQNFDEMFQYDNELILKIANSLNESEINNILNLFEFMKGYSFSNNSFIEYLTSFQKNGYNTFSGQLKRSLSRVVRVSTDSFFLLNYIYSILVSSDKADCILNNTCLFETQLKIPYNIVDDTKKGFSRSSDILNTIRNHAYEDIAEKINNLNDDDRILSINLPTGSGKTLASLNAALKLRKKFNSIERIIYCLPFTSIIDQNAEVFSNIIGDSDSDILLKHHHLSEFKYSSTGTEYDLNQSEFLISDWKSELVVTTFYQLLSSFFSTKNQELRKFKSLQNSIVILDEVQSIPQKYWALINQSLKKISTLLNIRFVLVTATLPLIFKLEEVVELASKKKEYFIALNRICLDVSNIKKPVSLIDFSQSLIQDINNHSDKSFLVILNTIQSSLFIFNKLKESGFSANYLSSNIIPLQRQQKIKEIKANSQKHQITVTTQIVEAGVDIDFDFVYRDFAPLDSIYQACGRCNRNNKNNFKGLVKIFKIISDRNVNKLLCNYIYDDINIFYTSELLKRYNIIEEKDFYLVANEYYEIISNAASNTTSLKILNDIQKMNYYSAFEGKDSFQLIEEFPSVKVYVSINDYSEKLIDEYKNLVFNHEMDTFKKRSALKEQFRKLNPYFLNIREKNKPDNRFQFFNQPDFFVIPFQEKEKYYNNETGFIIPE